MLFAHDVDLALQAAVDLVNSEAVSRGAVDTFDTIEALDDFWVEWGYTGRRDGDRAELDEVRALRPMLHQLLTADRDTAVDLVNDLLARARARPRLVRHDTLDWHLHAVSDDEPLALRITVETAMAMIDVIRADEHSRFSICAADDCAGVVLDLSRNRSRRFCSVTCGNRAAVAAYRERQSTQRAAPDD